MKTTVIYTLQYKDDYGCAFESLETARKMRAVYCNKMNIDIESVSIVKIETVTTYEIVG